MIQKKTLALALAVLAATSVSSVASAQRPTRIYGLAYSRSPSRGIPASLILWPANQVIIHDDKGHTWTATTDNTGAWWLDNMPSNRKYQVQAKATTEFGNWTNLGPVYSGWSAWVTAPERPTWQLNMTPMNAVVALWP